MILEITISLSTYILIIFSYMVSGNESLLYHYYWCGFSGIISGLLVAIKQLNPELGIPIFFISFRVKMLPSLIFITTLIISVVGFIFSETPFILLGIYYSWFYLRFLQRKGEIVGDLNDTFSFSSFFPDFLKPIIDKISSSFYNILDLCKFWKLIGVTEQSNSSIVLNYVDSADAERRRKRAAVKHGRATSILIHTVSKESL